MLAVIVVLAALYPWWPLTSHQRWGLYCGFGALALGMTWIVTLRRGAPLGWWLLLTGFSLNGIADLLYYRETVVLGMGSQFGLSDLVYMAAYIPLAAGLVAMGRLVGRASGALLDASIFALGLAVPLVAFYVLPAAAQDTIALDGMLLVGWYALGSILVFALYVHQVTSRRSHNFAFLIIGAALLMGAIGDSLWNVHSLMANGALGELSKLAWYLNRALPLVAIAHPSVQRLWEIESDPVISPLPRLRLVALTLGLLMPAITLLLALLVPSRYPYWIAVAGGGLLLPVLVLLRMDGLLQQLRTQAQQLDTLSHYDELTGAPNRRHWKRALAAAAARARRDGTPLALALLDLDHFKAFNDAHGHHAGDDLLCEAYQLWSGLLPSGCLLTRYGGEEFALLMPDATEQQATALLLRAQQITPGRQTFSAGVALCNPHADLANALDRADTALYQAKQAGRNRVSIAEPVSAPDTADRG